MALEILEKLAVRYIQKPHEKKKKSFNSTATIQRMRFVYAKCLHYIRIGARFQEVVMESFPSYRIRY